MELTETNNDIVYPVKSGYMRLMQENHFSYVSYKELASMGEEYLINLRQSVLHGNTKLYCACSAENDLELTITENKIIRVRHNGQQELHLDSCPKSIKYPSYIKENLKGADIDMDSQNLLFHISLPGVIKGASSSSSSSSTKSENSGKNSRVKLLEMVRTLNAYAWEKQTFSKKKEIATANKNKKTANWSYKTSADFIKLIYGVSNEISIQIGNQIGTLNNIFYRSKEFSECTDFKRRFFFYAEIEKISPFKAERKYQYVTVRMPSSKSPSKTVIRVHTEDYEKIFAPVTDTEEAYTPTRVLAGYINRCVFKNADQSVSEWATLLKGVTFFTSKNGLYAETPYTATLIDALCERRVLFKKPYLPLENYFNTMPTLMIERLYQKNLLIDILYDGKESTFATHEEWGSNNEEFACILLADNAKNVNDVVKEIVAEQNLSKPKNNTQTSPIQTPNPDYDIEEYDIEEEYPEPNLERTDEYQISNNTDSYYDDMEATQEEDIYPDFEDYY